MLWQAHQESAQRPHAHLPLWGRLRQGPQCCEKHPGRSFSNAERYPGAQRNLRAFGKRFWTDCFYPSLSQEDGQAGWLKEEPPGSKPGGCQTS